MCTHISTLLYTLSGSIDQVQKCINDNMNLSKKDQKLNSKKNRLYDLILGFSALIDSTNRTNSSKSVSMTKAFEYLNRHLINSDANFSQNTEAMYNIGRAFVHLNCPLLSMRMF
jgi:hypothetical protein